MENQPQVDLASFDNSWFKTGKSGFTRSLWYVANACLMKSAIPGSNWRRFLLRLFGAKIGKRIVIKPRVNIKYPWKLEVGDFSWIGEQVWIDNLAQVSIGKNCCISQGAMLLCGNHNYKKTSFDLMVGEIVLQDGVWLGAKSLVAPHVVCHTHSILTAGSIASKNLDAHSIYTGNPAEKIRERKMDL